MGFISLTMGDPSKPFGICRILWEALKLLTKNRSLMLPILVLSFLSSSLLFFTNYLSISPLLMDLFINLSVVGNTNPKSPVYIDLLATTKKDITNLTIIEAIFIIISFTISSFLLIATVHASATTYLNRQLTLEELFTRIKRSWTGPIVTQIYVAILTLGCTLLLSVLIAFFIWISNNSVFLIASGVALGLAALSLYLHLTTAWLLGVVVSVVEDGCYGVEALGRGMELIEGRKRQGVVISFLMMAATGGIYGAYTFSTAYVPQLTTNPVANGFVEVNVSVILNVIILAAYTVLYYECKKSHGEETPMRVGSVYTSLPSTSHVNQDFP